MNYLNIKINLKLILILFYFSPFVLFYFIVPATGEETDTTALIAQALELAKAGQRRVERIEQMMNSSLQQNEQFIQKGSEALNKLTNEEINKQEVLLDNPNKASKIKIFLNNYLPLILIIFLFLIF
uniref:Uncharacterized protein n=1 Tax=Meloidogyne enterolobii TaxID=390850 RepID=A0A6V7USA6_MELEN|nr:unnamed protein product [Meloidogyne enterolobii]